jgi:hypothetical protein
MEQANLKIRISADSSSLSSGLKKAGVELQKFYGAISATAVLGMSKRIIDQASAIVDLAKKTGVSTTALQAWTYAAKQNGASIEDVATSFKNLQKATVAALGDNGEKQAEAFGRLGISLETLKRTAPEKLFQMVAKSMGELPISAQASVDAMLLLGKAGDSMLPAFRDGFAEAADEAARLNQILGEETLAQLDKAGDQIDQFAGHFTTVLAPAIGWTIEKLRDLSDFLQITIGGSAAYLGALSAGASKEAAKQIAYGVADTVLDKRIKDDAALQSAAASLGRGGAVSPEVAGSVPVASRRSGSLPQSSPIQSDQLARIGLFRGGGGASVNMLLQKQVNQLTLAVGELQGIRAELTTTD